MARKDKDKATKTSAVIDLESTLQDLVNVRQAYEALRAMRLKGGKGARRIGKLLAILKIEFDDYDVQTRALIEEHGEKKPGSLGHWINNENDEQREAFGAAHKELLEDTVDLRFRPISMSDFGDTEVPMAVLSDLSKFFDFEEDEVEPKPEEKDEDESDDEDKDDDEKDDDSSE